MSADFFLNGENLDCSTFKPFKLRELRFKGGGKPDTSIKDTEDQKALAKIAIERFDRYQKTFKPVENRYMDEIDQLDSREKMSHVGSDAVVNTETAFADALKDEVGAITGAGININSGATNKAIDDVTLRKGAAVSDNVNMSQQALQDQKVKGLQGVVAMGNGQANEAITGLGEISEYSKEEARDQAVGKFNSSGDTKQAIGAVGGMAYSAYRNGKEELGGV